MTGDVHPPRIGILGRQPQMLQRALEMAAAAGLDAVGSTREDDILGWIAGGHIRALVIGGGVEEASRAAMQAACAGSGVEAIPVSGPHALAEVFEALAKRT
jgi:hypothetical protein